MYTSRREPLGQCMLYVLITFVSSTLGALDGVFLPLLPKHRPTVSFLCLGSRDMTTTRPARGSAQHR